MPFKLTKAQLAEKEEISHKMDATHEAMTNAVGAYEEAIEAAKEFAKDIAETAQGEIEEKSERWQEGDRGTAATAWAEAWGEFEPDEVDLPDSAETAFSELPDEAEG